MSELATQRPSEEEVDSPGEDRTTTVVLRRDQRGMVSAEWAVGLIAAVAIAGVLLAVVTAGAVKEGILSFVLVVIKAFSNHLGGI